MDRQDYLGRLDRQEQLDRQDHLGRLDRQDQLDRGYLRPSDQ